MTFQLKVKKTSAGSKGAVLVSAPTEAAQHQFNLWYTANAQAMGFGSYDPHTDLTTWTIYLSKTASGSVKEFSLNSTFNFIWGQSLDLVDQASPAGTAI